MGVLRTVALAAVTGFASIVLPTEASVSKPSAELASEHFCLAEAIYFEARTEPRLGQMAVGLVIMNRTRSADYPDTICGVVNQNAHLFNRCQFSYRCDGKIDMITEWEPWQEILRRSALLLACNDECTDQLEMPRGSLALSTHYHATSVSPSWSRKLRRTGQIGRHIFYQV
jgi:spore germination cell wall hydrolase CwlJ-like protein